jgi:hypothetical protein
MHARKEGREQERDNITGARYKLHGGKRLNVDAICDGWDQGTVIRC